MAFGERLQLLRRSSGLTQEQFAVVTGWGKRCNQHERDAAIAAWPYRRAAHV